MNLLAMEQGRAGQGRAAADGLSCADNNLAEWWRLKVMRHSHVYMLCPSPSLPWPLFYQKFISDPPKEGTNASAYYRSVCLRGLPAASDHYIWD